MKNKLLLIVATALTCFNCYAQSNRTVIDFNKDWKFHFSYDFTKTAKITTLDLPHTWNADDAVNGIADYKRTSATYEKNLLVTDSLKTKRLFLYFEGVNNVASLFINNKMVSEHKGGYTAFCIEITNFVQPGQNSVKVIVSNAYRLDVLPIHGDFNIYGGIHRPVSLIATNNDCISLLDHGSPGVYISQKDVSKQNATISILSKLSIKTDKRLALVTTIVDKNKIIHTANQTVDKSINEWTQNFELKNPKLWNGKENPFMYEVLVTLKDGDKIIDQVRQPLGVRYFKVDPDKGFFLNGKYLDLVGAGRHEDVKGKGSALNRADQVKDFNLLKELGATSVRLTHYPHNKIFYNLADSAGLIIWSEIPFVGEGGYNFTGYVKNPLLENNARQYLIELIRQNYNHPSICFWGLFNELKYTYDNPDSIINELNQLAKKEDPYRLTTMASNMPVENFQKAADLMAWNQYFGWYGSSFDLVKKWADETHAAIPHKPFALSEYGAGASPYKHYEQFEKVVPDSKFHPEEYQAKFHEVHWDILKDRPFVWGKYIWCLADFGSSIRTEGDQNGINDKGIVTYDRAIKKDAFYFYKANWNKEPMLYLAEKRNNQRTKDSAIVKVYTNLDHVTLTVNNKKYQSLKRNQINTIEWKNVKLNAGENKVLVSGKLGNKLFTDSCTWIKKP